MAPHGSLEAESLRQPIGPLPQRRGRSARALSLVAGAIIGLTACNTQGDGNGPNRIRIADPAGQLRAIESALRNLTQGALSRVIEHLGVTGVTITIMPDAAQAIAGYGIGGWTPDAATVLIFVDPQFPRIAELLPARLPQLVAHELHHAVRWRDPGYGRTLLEAMISEGMADRFSIALLGVDAPPWTDAVPPEETDEHLTTARAEFDSDRYNHAEWFFGAGGRHPRWIGYTLGFRLVEAYQEAHPGVSPVEFARLPAAVFRPN